MKARTSDFKNLICGVKETKTKITYGSVELGDEQLNSIQPHYEGGILTSVMKQLDLDSNVEIPNGTILNLQFGVKVRDASGNDDGYDYINYGNYIVKESEKQEDTNSYLIKCYDKMLYSMKDYETFATYPITIRDYLTALCTQIGLTFKNANDYFTNYDKTLDKELYLDENGNSLNYTYRDVLDELAQATASTICINEDDDELEIRYISNAGEQTTNVSGTSLSITSEDSQTNEIELLGNTTQETTTGKNLLPNDLATKTVSGITITKNSDGTYKVNGTATADVSEAICNDFISLSGTWRMLGCPSGGSSSTYMLSAYVGYWGAGSPNIDTGSGTNITYTGNVKVRLYIKSGTTCNNLIFKPMLTTDTSTTTFEKYTYGASPNPNYPQEVVNVTGRQEVKCVGKNLANPNNVNMQCGLNDSGAMYSGATTRVCVYKVPIKPSTTYSLSCENGYQIGNVFQYDSSGTYTSTVSSSYARTKQYTSSSTTYYISFVLKNDGNTTINVNEKDNLNVQIEVSNTSTDYEPYKEETNEINLGKNLYNYPETEVNLVKSTTRTIQITTNLPLTLQAGTYTISFPDLVMTNNNYNLAVEPVGVTPGGSQLTNKSRTFTITEAKTLTSLYIYINSSDNDNATATFSKIQLEKGSQATTYSEYFTPIELCKIGTYKDKIFKNSGKNLLDIQSIVKGRLDNGVLGYESNTTALTLNSNNFSFTTNANWRGVTSNYIKVEPNTDYIVSAEDISGVTTLCACYDSSKTFLSNTATINIDSKSRKYSMPNNTAYIRLNYQLASSGTITIKNPMIEKSSSATEYEPYGSGEWYVKKAIGKVVLDGTENWATASSAVSNTTRFYYENNNIKNTGNSGDNNVYVKSNMFKGVGFSDIYSLDTTTQNAISNYNNSNNLSGRLNIRISNTYASTVANFKTWLGTNKPIVYYVLSTPTYEKLNDILQEQLNSIRLLEGTNNVMSNVPIDLTYVSGIDTLDEEYFNEDNVNFGEMYGPVNTIILSRSAESDEIAQSIPSNLSDDEKVAIKIKENQIMNFDNRDEYLYGILTRLYGLRYTQNDYSSKGICYYNVCDRYKANIFGKNYYCVMLNDDVTIESGLSENVYTELPETAQTDYSKTSTSDRIERQTTLIVDKQAGEIRGLVSGLDNEINGDNGIESRLSTAETTLREDSATLRFITENTINEDGSVKALKTSTDYTFDSEGLKIGKSTDDYNSLQDNTGTYYYEKDTMIGKYTKDGSVQKDLALYGKYYYGIDEEGDFDVNTFERSDALFLAQLYTNSSNEEGFGHFYNGA